jgi:hypothetical protein
MMKRRFWSLIEASKAFIRLVVRCCAVLCLLFSYPLSALAGGSGDTLWISAVDPLPRPAGNDLHSGQDIQIRLRAKYILNIADQATLHVYLEEFPFSAGGCTGAVHQTNGAGDVLITRGSAIRLLTAVWRGSSPSYPKGYIAVGGSIFTTDGNREIGSFGYSPICYHFFPPGGQGID